MRGTGRRSEREGEGADEARRLFSGSGNGLDSDCQACIRALNRGDLGLELVRDLWT